MEWFISPSEQSVLFFRSRSIPTNYNYPLLMCIAAYNVYYTYPPPHPPPWRVKYRHFLKKLPPYFLLMYPPYGVLNRFAWMKKIHRNQYPTKIQKMMIQLNDLENSKCCKFLSLSMYLYFNLQLECILFISIQPHWDICRTSCALVLPLRAWKSQELREVLQSS